MEPIHEAAALGDLEEVAVLLDEDPGLVDRAGNTGGTPLMYAAQGGFVEESSSPRPTRIHKPSE
jgi:hypothetical protein